MIALSKLMLMSSLIMSTVAPITSSDVTKFTTSNETDPLLTGQPNPLASVKVISSLRGTQELSDPNPNHIIREYDDWGGDEDDGWDNNRGRNDDEDDGWDKNRGRNDEDDDGWLG